MRDFVSSLPNSSALKQGLTSALRSEKLRSDCLTLLGREATPYSTTFPCEIVTYRVGRESPRRLFCKYTGGVDYTGHGHRGGVGYEIATYRNVLRQAKGFRPHFYGGYTDPETGQHWLFLEYLDRSLRVGKLGDADAMAKTARWIARFHVASQRLLTTKSVPFLKRYNKDYYLGWVLRTSEFASSLPKRPRWFHQFRERAEEFLSPLLSFRPTIIHGEYYQHNIMVHRGKVCPIDWESAAVGEGLIDLATLTQGWEPKIAEICRNAYVQTRWPQGPPGQLDKVLRAAQLYIIFRWLGDDADTTCSPRGREYWTQLRDLAAELEHA